MGDGTLFTQSDSQEVDTDPNLDLRVFDPIDLGDERFVPIPRDFEKTSNLYAQEIGRDSTAVEEHMVHEAHHAVVQPDQNRTGIMSKDEIADLISHTEQYFDHKYSEIFGVVKDQEAILSADLPLLEDEKVRHLDTMLQTRGVSEVQREIIVRAYRSQVEAEMRKLQEMQDRLAEETEIESLLSNRPAA